MAQTKWREGLVYELDPDDAILVEFDWSDWLAEVGGDTIADAIETAATPLRATGESIVGGTAVRYLLDWSAAPTEGNLYAFSVQIVTAGNQKKTRSINIKAVSG